MSKKFMERKATIKIFKKEERKEAEDWLSKS
jgi:hypothetical protein